MSSHLRTKSLVVAAALLVSAPLLASQEAGKAKQKDVAKAVPAAAVVQQTVSLPVTGLTKEDASKVQTTLTAMTHEMWVCPGCKGMQEEKGTCTSCKKDLVAKAMPVLSRVAPDLQHGTLDFALNEGMHVKLSELERALGSGAVKVDPAKLVLADSTMLYVQGPPSAEAAKKLEQSLKASKLFESMHVEHKADSRDYHIKAVASEEGPTHAALAKAIEAVGDGFKLIDVGWVAPKRIG